MKRLLSVLGMFCVVSAVALAQEKPATKPSFVIADVHDSPYARQVYSVGGPMHGDRYNLRQSTLVDIIALAYGVKPEMVQGGPSWLEMRRFDVVAKADPKTSEADQKLMLQSLLAERFGLVMHKGEAPLPAYVLTAPGGKTKMKQSPEDAERNCKPQNGQEMAGGAPLNVISCSGFSADEIATLLAQVANNYLPDPVLNQTRLEGKWEFTIKWTDMRQRAKAGAEAVSIFNSVQNDLGLMLERKTAPRPVWIVDRASETPTPNSPAVAKELPPLPMPQFEVSTIKPSGPNSKPGGMIRNGQMTLSMIPIKFLLTYAWDFNPNDPQMIVNMPAWIETDKFDIVAKAAMPEPVAGQLPPQIEDRELRLMLQQLLMERFNMKVHMEERPIEAYTIYADHPKLKAADPTSRTHCKEGPGPDGKDPRQANPMLTALFTCQNVSMRELAAQLAEFATGYVYTLPVDATGLTGRYDLTMAWSSASLTVLKPPPAPGQPVSSDPDGAVTLDEAMHSQLGLKMVKTKRPVQVLVIDHVEETPTAN
ncbi:TIGR03435 family protein [Terriglobus roseus]|uniref:Soil-associated protein, TIGR03435 family n=1 Tax=Terriglobus roseus TaxID=392734 RepID=A0A1G7MHN2_9BACT|nr:TIGR03435 family protein [Terriglobus roseus]SDF61255.1 soil-associated protein, TIGR03435 family [Terriglobus roseus]